MIARTLADVADIMSGTLRGPAAGAVIRCVTVHSKRIKADSLFVALAGAHRDGHDFVSEALRNGGVAAVVSRAHAATLPASFDGSLICVDAPLTALRDLARHVRARDLRQVIAITGSNGKTICKDALGWILAAGHRVSVSPGSFNSQIGVPLAILQADAQADFFVFEAGVSRPGEMRAHRDLLQPDYALLTNIGLAHIEHFGTRDAIAHEKLELFSGLPATGWSIVPASHDFPWTEELSGLACPVHRLGDSALPRVTRIEPRGLSSRIRLAAPDGSLFDASVEAQSTDLIHDIHLSVCGAYLLGMPIEAMLEPLSTFRVAPARMEIWQSSEGFTVVNDSHTSDPISVRAALRSTMQMATPGGRKHFVFGGMRELGEISEREHEAIGELAAEYGFDTLVTVGASTVGATRAGYERGGAAGRALAYDTIDEAAERLSQLIETGDIVLFKGPRGSDIDLAAAALREAIAPSRLVIHLPALASNVRVFRRICGPHVRILGMVKALAYGSQLWRIASVLAELGVDSLGVATVEEGVELRRRGVSLPVLIMDYGPSEVARLLRFELTPVVSSRHDVPALAQHAESSGHVHGVHLKIDTGLGRRGVAPPAALSIAEEIRRAPALALEGVMTHFACAEDEGEDDFTRSQIEAFDRVVNELEDAGFEGLCAHAAATAAAIRFAQARYDMVRIGLGLFGVYPSTTVADSVELQPVCDFVSRITRVRTLEAGARIGYGGTYRVDRPMRIGVVPLGYDDGVPLSASNAGAFLVHGQRCPIVGRVSMDATTIDLTEVPAAVPGTEVLVFGELGGHELPIEEAAAAAGTIPYELLTRIGSRVQRVFIDG